MLPEGSVSPGDRQEFPERDRLEFSEPADAFDALVASLVARAAYRGLTLKPTPDELTDARAEGWIALPNEGSLESLPLESS